MKENRAFFDTNVLVYAFAKDDLRTEIAETLLAEDRTVSVQNLNEFVSVTVRKLSMSWEEVTEALDALRVLFPSPMPVTIRTHEATLHVMGRHRYHIYDSLVIAAALEASYSTLYSEDMHHGQVIDGLTIRNPFRS